MLHPTVLTSSVVLAFAFAAPAAVAQDYVTQQGYIAQQQYVGAAQEYVAVGSGRQIVGSRCADLGPDFIEMGNGVCGRIGTNSRVQLGARSAGMNDWTSSATTSATLRSEGLLPGAAVQHLRVHGYAPASPFQ